MSVQSDAAKAHIEKLFNIAYPHNGVDFNVHAPWQIEYCFALPRRWAFDYAVPAIKCAIEIDGGTASPIIWYKGKPYIALSGHNSPTGMRNDRERNNAAMSAGWHVWHYAPEEVIKAGRKTLPDEPILKKLPWM